MLGQIATVMRRLCISGLLIVLALLGVVALKRTSSLPQPEYQGKPLAWWVTERSIASTSEQAQRAETALREMGTNSLPYILSELQRRDSKPVDWLMRLLQRVRPFRIQYTPPAIRHYHAQAALTAIGPALGKPRVLELMAHQSQYVREAAAHALAEFAVPEGQQALVASLNSSNLSVRAAAAVGLRGGGYFPHTAIMPLASCIGDADAEHAELRTAAAETLVEYCRIYAGRVPEVALSNLVHSLGDSSPAVRRFSATALGLAKPQGELVIAALTVATNDPDPTVRDSALSALTLIGPDAAERVAERK